MKNTTWGWHLSFDAWNCDPDKMNSAQNIENFTNELVKRIDMVAFGYPDINWFGSGDKEGYTLSQLIETSNICCHFDPTNKAAYFDVFSCKPYDSVLVIDTFKEFFGGDCHNIHFRERKFG